MNHSLNLFIIPTNPDGDCFKLRFHVIKKRIKVGFKLKFNIVIYSLHKSPEDNLKHPKLLSENNDLESTDHANASEYKE